MRNFLWWKCVRRLFALFLLQGKSVSVMASALPSNEMSLALNSAALAGSITLVHLNSRINLTEEDIPRFTAHLPFLQLAKRIVTFKNVQKCEEYIRQASNDRILLCVNGCDGKVIVPRIHALSQVNVISMYCSDVTEHKKWADNYDKVG